MRWDFGLATAVDKSELKAATTCELIDFSSMTQSKEVGTKEWKLN